MKLCVFGSRNIGGEVGEELVRYATYGALLSWNKKPEDIEEWVSGHAPGVDKAGEKVARVHGLQVKAFPAAWEDLTARPCRIRTRGDGSQYNALAGLNRNGDMAVYATHFVGVWDGESTGTKQMIESVQIREKPLYVYIVP